MFRDWKYCTANDVSKETFQEIEGMVQDALSTERDVDIERECIKIAIAAYLTGCDCALTPDGEFMILKKSAVRVTDDQKKIPAAGKKNIDLYDCLAQKCGKMERDYKEQAKELADTKHKLDLAVQYRQEAIDARKELEKKYCDLSALHASLDEAYGQLGEENSSLKRELMESGSATACVERLKALGFVGTLTKTETLNIGD